MAIAIVIATPALLVLIEAPSEATNATYSYIFYITLSSPVFGILESMILLYITMEWRLSVIFRGSRDHPKHISRLCVYLRNVQSLRNGISDTAIATALSEFVAVVIKLTYFVMRGVKGKMRFTHLLLDKELLREMIEIELPMSGSR